VTVQYDRKLSIVVGTNAGSGIEFGEFKLQFRVQRGDWQSPNSCDVRIFNLSDHTANQISTREFTHIAVQAGYQGNLGLIFRGVIKQVRIGRADAYGIDYQSQADNYRLSLSVKTNADGLYYVLSANHTGDTRGKPWYTDLIMLAVDATVFPDSAINSSTALPAEAIRRF
jgi:hypothetical protein